MLRQDNVLMMKRAGLGCWFSGDNGYGSSVNADCYGIVHLMEACASFTLMMGPGEYCWQTTFGVPFGPLQ